MNNAQPPVPTEPDATNASAPQGLPEDRSVDIGRGLEWLKTGWQFFIRNPGAWVAMAVIWIVIISALSLLPGIGHLAIVVINPLLVAGALIGCRELEAGRALEISHLFEGFRRNTTPLLVLGAILMAASFAAGLLAMMLAGGAAATGALFGDGFVFGIGVVSGMVLGFGSFLLIGIPIAMASWFAPALVMFQDVPPVDALKRSFWACLRNPGAMLVFGIIAAVLCFLAMVPFGLGMLVVLPVLSGGLYQSWREVFDVATDVPAGAA